MIGRSVDLIDFIDYVQHSLHVGRSYLPLAATALSALEHWHSTLPAAALQTYYPDILPLLDAYLKSTANLGNLHFGPKFTDIVLRFILRCVIRSS